MTAREEQHRQDLKQELKKLGLNLAAIIHAPNKKDGHTSNKISQDSRDLLHYLLSLKTLPQCLIIIDELPENLHNLEIAFSQTPQIAAIPRLLLLKQQQKFDVINHLEGGSGGVYVLQDPKGEKWTFKCVSNAEEMKEEILADALYQAAGVHVPAFRIYHSLPVSLQGQVQDCKGPGPYRLARFIEKDTTTTPNDLKKAMQQHFVADAFFSNWDIVVGDFRNVIMDQNGTLWRIDNGGSLRYRAVGGRKQQGLKWQPEQVIELETLRNAAINKAGASIYGDLSDAEIAAQAHALLKKAPEVFAMLNQVALAINLDNAEEVRVMLRARMDDLAKRYPLQAHSFLASMTRPHAKAAAGVLVYSRDPQSNEPVVLLGQRIRHQWWGNLGGKSDVDPTQGAIDQTLAATAVREVKEESMGLLLFTEPQLNRLTSHDLESPDGALYRMYLAAHPYIDAATFNTKLQTVTDAHQKEYTEFRWVAVKDLLQALMQEQAKVVEEGQETIKIGDLILHAPLYRMLASVPVRDALTKIESNLDIKSRHTRGSGDQIKVTWDKVDPANSQATVPLGSNAAGKVITKRYVGDIEEEVYDDAQAAQQQFADAVVAKSKVISHLKEIQAANNQKKKDKAALLPAIGTYTQSDAYLQLTLGEAFTEQQKDPQQLISTYFSHANISNRLLTLFIDKPEDEMFLTLMTNVLKKERDQEGWYVFYHATESMMGFLYDIFSAYRQRLEGQLPNSNPTLRALEMAFVGINNVDDFIAAFQDAQGYVDNYSRKGGKSYQDMGLSVNPFLFGSEGDTGSSSIYLFHSNKSVSPPNYQKLFEAFARALGIDRRWQDFIPLYERYQQGNSRLYQIFIHPDYVDEVAYTAVLGGSPAKFKLPDQDMLTSKITPTFSILRTNPKEFSNLLAKAVIKTGQLQLHTLQARLFLKPQYFHNRDIVQIEEYQRRTADKNQQIDYRKHLEAMIDEDLSKWLQKHQNTRQGMILKDNKTGDKQEQKMPLIQQQYKAAYEATTGQTFQAKQQRTSFSALIEAGDIDSIERFLTENPEMNLNTSVIEENEYYTKNTSPLPPILTVLTRKAPDYLLVPNYREIIKLLIDKGAAIDVRNEAGEGLLDMAIRENDIALITWLLSDPERQTILLDSANIKNKSGRTPLHAAAAAGKVSIIDILFQNERDRNILLDNKNIKDNQGQSPLHLAADMSFVDTIEALLQNEQARNVLLNDDNIKDDQGLTPLHSAVERGSIITIQALLKNEEARKILLKDENQRNGFEENVLDLARWSGSDEVADLVENAMKELGLPIPPP